MTCVTTAVRFRLLDPNVGWDADDAISWGIDGAYDRRGLRLHDPDEPKVTSDELTPYMPPGMVTPGCGPCEWYLVSCDKHDVSPPPYWYDPEPIERPILLHRNACSDGWRDIMPDLAGSDDLTEPIAVAADRRRFSGPRSGQRCRRETFHLVDSRRPLSRLRGISKRTRGARSCPQLLVPTRCFNHVIGAGCGHHVRTSAIRHGLPQRVTSRCDQQFSDWIRSLCQIAIDPPGQHTADMEIGNGTRWRNVGGSRRATRSVRALPHLSKTLGHSRIDRVLGICELRRRSQDRPIRLTPAAAGIA